MPGCTARSGYGIAEGGGNDIFGTSGFFFHFDQVVGQGAAALQDVARDVRVLLVDDQPLVRTGFRMILEGEEGLEVVGGPRLGLLTLSKIPRSEGGQWIVSAHAIEPTDCGGAGSTIPTS